MFEDLHLSIRQHLRSIGYIIIPSKSIETYSSPKNHLVVSYYYTNLQSHISYCEVPFRISSKCVFNIGLFPYG